MKNTVAKIAIGVDEFMNLDVQFSGDKRYSMLLLGAMELAKGVVIDQIPIAVTSEMNASPRKELEVSKDQAVGIYLKAWKMIEKRIQAINQAEDDQKFIIDKAFISQLGLNESGTTGQ